MGNGLSQLTEEQVQRLKETTPFVEADMARLLKRYAKYDDSERGTTGIPYKVVVAWPEFQAHPLLPRLLELYVTDRNRILLPEKFLYLAALLSKDTPVRQKRDAAFKCFDISNAGRLGHRELYLMFDMLYRSALTNNQLLMLVDRALSQPHLSTPGHINPVEFGEMISDWEIRTLFTVELQTG